jgi:hypothetical protein
MRWLSCLGLEFVDAGATASEGGGPRWCLIDGNMAVVMVLFFGHLGGEEQAGGPWWRRRFGNDISHIVF